MVRRVIAGLILATFLTACTTHTWDKPWGSGAVGGAIIGAAALGTAGGVIANNVSPPFTPQDEDRGAGIAIGIVTGAILGALIGHWCCDPEPEPPPPPPAPPPAAKQKIVLRGVNFDFDRSTLRPDARPILDEAARILQGNPDLNVQVQGHTDNVGTKEYNLRLSMRRAQTVKNYLVARGVAASRLETEGFGFADPVASNATAEGRAQNRRVELVPTS
jgi:outer membrane protein OmpA-like peptidoglycan-associated protein